MAREDGELSGRASGHREREIRVSQTNGGRHQGRSRVKIDRTNCTHAIERKGQSLGPPRKMTLLGRALRLDGGLHDAPHGLRRVDKRDFAGFLESLVDFLEQFSLFSLGCCSSIHDFIVETQITNWRLFIVRM